jgi:CubicO group peptidase (beta-lactamase class C family)
MVLELGVSMAFSHRLTRRTLLRAAGAAAAIPALGLAADFGAAGWIYGPEYVRRLLLWPRSRLGEAALFPVRPIAQAPIPYRFEAPTRETELLVRTAFAKVAARYGLAEVDFDQALAKTGTTGFAVLNDNRLLYEGYFNGRARASEQTSFSIAKSAVALLVGAAIADELISSVEAPVEAYLPDLPGLRDSGVTLQHLLRMSAGFYYRGGGPRREFLLGPWSHTRLLLYAPASRRVAAGVQLAHTPGTRFQYDGRCTQLLGIILERVAREPVADYFGRRLWRPLGAEFPASWNLDSTASGLEKLESGLNARTLDFAKLGRLVLRGGDWDGKRLVPAEWIDAMVAPPEAIPADYYGAGFSDETGSPRRYYGLQWWGFEWPGGGRVPFAAGYLGNIILIEPESRTVIVRNADSEGGIQDWPALLRDMVEFLG